MRKWEKMWVYPSELQLNYPNSEYACPDYQNSSITWTKARWTAYMAEQKLLQQQQVQNSLLWFCEDNIRNSETVTT